MGTSSRQRADAICQIFIENLTQFLRNCCYMGIIYFLIFYKTFYKYAHYINMPAVERSRSIRPTAVLRLEISRQVPVGSYVHLWHMIPFAHIVKLYIIVYMASSTFTYKCIAIHVNCGNIHFVSKFPSAYFILSEIRSPISEQLTRVVPSE